MQICFCCFVILLAIFQFSENTADVDLWGHVTFGQAMLKTHSIPQTDTYSWTAAGHKWVNHECLAEIAIGGMHALLGGEGLLLLKMAIGLLSFGMALRLGIGDLAWPERYIAWAVGALAVVEISYGFAVRPQIFTALFLVVELALLCRIHAGGIFGRWRCRSCSRSGSTPMAACWRDLACWGSRRRPPRRRVFFVRPSQVLPALH